MARVFLRDCIPGDVLDDVYVVTGKQFSATSSGKHFIKLFVSDRSMQVTSRIWNATREMFNAMPESGFLKLRGRVENYQNNLQVIVEQMWPAKAGTFELSELLPHTSKDITAMCAKLTEIMGTLQNRFVAAIVQAYFSDEAMMKNFCRAPAAMSFHHAFLGGLLEHTLNALEVADAIVNFYPGLSRDLVLAGIFLHDIAKTWELSYDTSFGYTDGGQLVGHIAKSAMWVEDKARSAEQKLGEPVPRNVIEVLQHIILSHHGVPEFGAVKIPATPEAIAVHMIENLDAKLMMSLAATRGEPSGNSEGNWSEYVKSLGTRLYRPDVSMIEFEETAEQEPLQLTKSPTVEPAKPSPPAQAEKSAPLAEGSLIITNPLFESSPARRK
jgi:3'-5' exoribonuclease